MSDCRADFDLTGAIKLVKALDKMGKSPQKAVTRGASAGATVARKAYKAAPVPVGETGNLLRAVKSVKKSRHKFKRRQRGVAMYDITWPEDMNAVLQKPVKNPGEAGSTATKNGHAYYPNSIEYGFLTRSKGGGYSYVPGKHIVRTQLEQAEPQVGAVTVNVLEKELDKLWQEAKHK